jgi:hypothetical protein
MPDHASARLNRVAGGYLPQNAVAETEYEIDASIGEDPVPFVAMRWPLEQPNALDEFLESRHRLAFTQLHVFVSSPSPMADRIVNLRLTVLDESDAEDGLAQTASRGIPPLAGGAGLCRLDPAEIGIDRREAASLTFAHAARPAAIANEEAARS